MQRNSKKSTFLIIKNQLWAVIQNHWTGIDIQMCHTLVDSMLQRYNEALAKNGLTTHY
jgi:hypothetical protein